MFKNLLFIHDILPFMNHNEIYYKMFVYEFPVISNPVDALGFGEGSILRKVGFFVLF